MAEYKLIDGKATATAIKQQIAVEVEQIVAGGGKRPHLAAILVGHDGGSETYVKNKVILVTGGGGSIGSELCRQLAFHNPKQLIILDVYENSVYDIQNELKYKYPNLDLVTLIGSVRDTKRLDYIFTLNHRINWVNRRLKIIIIMELTTTAVVDALPTSNELPLA
mgnify:CR=1 FL=1